MNKNCEWSYKIFSVVDQDFEALALEIFYFQYQHNAVYKAYIQALRTDVSKVITISAIPFLPISFFKTHTVANNVSEKSIVFESSGTSGSINSQHMVRDITLYEKSFISSFEFFYGSIKDYCIIGLLPSYLERKNSSLLYMVDRLILLSNHAESGFYLHEFEKLQATLASLENRKQKTLLIGVTFALLDFAEKYSFPLQYTTIMETGGMKGRRKEIIRNEAHERIKKSFSIASVHSEYGMTELLSQAYSKGNGIFQTRPWMRVMAREENDPLHIQTPSDKNLVTQGALNIIDLANIYSCSFIATDDIGKVYPNGSFEVYGRMDNSDLRGCNLLII